MLLFGAVVVARVVVEPVRERVAGLGARVLRAWLRVLPPPVEIDLRLDERRRCACDRRRVDAVGARAGTPRGAGVELAGAADVGPHDRARRAPDRRRGIGGVPDGDANAVVGSNARGIGPDARPQPDTEVRVVDVGCGPGGAPEVGRTAVGHRAVARAPVGPARVVGDAGRGTGLHQEHVLVVDARAARLADDLDLDPADDRGGRDVVRGGAVELPLHIERSADRVPCHGVGRVAGVRRGQERRGCARPADIRHRRPGCARGSRCRPLRP